MRKTVFILLLGLVLSFSVSAADAAEIGTPIGKIYTTDILAYVDDAPIRAYALDGKTAIVVEDLTRYGFIVGYDDKSRTLYAFVKTNTYEHQPDTDITRGTVGQTAGEIYASDITTTINGVPVPCFTLNGVTAVAIEDIAADETQNQTSPTCMTYKWYAENRTITLRPIYDTTDKIASIFYAAGHTVFPINEIQENGVLTLRENSSVTYGGPKIIARLPEDAYAITNIDDRNGMVMVQNTKAHVVTYSCRSMADHTARVMEESFEGMMLKVDGRETWTNLIGMHNAYNILAVYTTAIVLGAGQEEALVAISSLRSAPGRLENLRGPRGISVVIDYAHTPDALENVLKTLREIAPERTLICLFGCGGDRDRTKRPEMGKIAGQMADRIIVTSDNSRTEDTRMIMDEIMEGMDSAGKSRSLLIEDREQAIRTAIMTAPDNATILLAGKGHEDYQIIGTEKRHFDEKEIVEATFSNM